MAKPRELQLSSQGFWTTSFSFQQHLLIQAQHCCNAITQLVSCYLGTVMSRQTPVCSNCNVYKYPEWTISLWYSPCCPHAYESVNSFHMYLKVKGPQGKESEASTFWKIQLTLQKHFLPHKLWTNFTFHQSILQYHSSDKIYAVDIYREG